MMTPEEVKAYASKPLTPEEIQAKVEKLIAKRKECKRDQSRKSQERWRERHQ